MGYPRVGHINFLNVLPLTWSYAHGADRGLVLTRGVPAVLNNDIVKGRRNPPDVETLRKIAIVLNLDSEEKALMYDLAGRERNEAAPDLPEYLMSEDIPHVRAALRRASDKKLGDDFWKRVFDQIEQEEENN